MVGIRGPTAHGADTLQSWGEANACGAKCLNGGRQEPSEEEGLGQIVVLGHTRAICWRNPRWLRVENAHLGDAGGHREEAQGSRHEVFKERIAQKQIPVPRARLLWSGQRPWG